MFVSKQLIFAFASEVPHWNTLARIVCFRIRVTLTKPSIKFKRLFHWTRGPNK